MTMPHDLSYRGQEQNPVEGHGGGGSVRSAAVPAGGDRADRGTSAVGCMQLAVRLPSFNLFDLSGSAVVESDSYCWGHGPARLASRGSA